MRALLGQQKSRGCLVACGACPGGFPARKTDTWGVVRHSTGAQKNHSSAAFMEIDRLKLTAHASSLLGKEKKRK